MIITATLLNALHDAEHLLFQEAETWKNQDRETFEVSLRNYEAIKALREELQPLFRDSFKERFFKLMPVE